MKSNVREANLVRLILNIGAVIMGVLAVFNAYVAHKYISGLILNGLKVKEQLTDVINCYATSITPYVFYGLSLFTLSFIVKQNIKEVDGRELLEPFLQTGEEINKGDDLIDELIDEINNREHQ